MGHAGVLPSVVGRNPFLLELALDHNHMSGRLPDTWHTCAGEGTLC